jgi:hypothetical protein
MVAYAYRMPAGIPGEVNRIASAAIEAQVVSTATNEAPTAYGVPVVVSATGGNVGNMRQLAAADAGGVTSIYGFLVRPFPTGASQDALSTSTPPTAGIIDMLKRGYMHVLLQGSTAAAKGGQVYIYVGASASGHPLCGQVEAASSSNCIVPGSSYFMGPADTNGIVEIAFNI